MTKEQLEEINNRLADVLVYMRGYKDAVNIHQKGNKQGRQSALAMCDWIETNLLDGKRTIVRALQEMKE